MQYVGKTIDSLEVRREQHEGVARSKKGLYFQRALYKYHNDFEWKVLEEGISKEDLNEREKWWIWWLDTRAPNRYNLTSGGDGGDANRGNKHSEKTKAKMRIYHRNKKLTKEHKAKIGKAMKGRKLPPLTKEAKAKISKAVKGRKVTEETRAKMRASHPHGAPMKGKKHSEETKRKMSIAQSTRKRKPLSEEHKAKLSITQKKRFQKQTLAKTSTLVVDAPSCSL